MVQEKKRHTVADLGYDSQWPGPPDHSYLIVMLILSFLSPSFPPTYLVSFDDSSSCSGTTDHTEIKDKTRQHRIKLDFLLSVFCLLVQYSTTQRLMTTRNHRACRATQYKYRQGYRTVPVPVWSAEQTFFPVQNHPIKRELELMIGLSSTYIIFKSVSNCTVLSDHFTEPTLLRSKFLFSRAFQRASNSSAIPY